MVESIRAEKEFQHDSHRDFVNRTSLYEQSSIRNIPCQVLTNNVILGEIEGMDIFYSYGRPEGEAPGKRKGSNREAIVKQQGSSATVGGRNRQKLGSHQKGDSA